MKQRLIFFILAYFRFFAKLQLKKIKPIIIGITGTAGKTSTRNAIYSILKKQYKVKVSYKANSETGIPLNILGLTHHNYSFLDWLRLTILTPIKLLTNFKKYDIYLVEMGIDSPFPPKNMSYLLTIIQPNIAVILNAGTTHAQVFDQLVKTNNLKLRRKQVIHLIAQEKGKVITNNPKLKFAIINHDQEEINQLAQQTSAQVVTFGQTTDSQVKFSNYQVSKQGSTFTFKYQDTKLKLFFKNQLLAQHFGYSLASSLAVAIALKINFIKAGKALEQNFYLPKGRSTLIKGINNSLIIDSSYNSSKASLIDMLAMLSQLPSTRKIAVLGDMREVGQSSSLEHQEVAKQVIKTCDLVILIGPLMHQYALPIIKQTPIKVSSFLNPYLALKHLKPLVKDDDLILIKGSQNTLMLEIITQGLMQDKNTAEKLLARRGAYWEQQRAKLKPQT